MTTVGESQAQAECFLLCDFARAENGKLYIVGGGWDRIIPQELPLTYDAYLATKLILPGDLLRDAVSVRVELLDSKGHVLGEPVLESAIESGPIHPPEGFEEKLRLVVTIFMGTAIKMDIVEPGRFTLKLLINGDPIASTGFIVSPVPTAQRE